MWRIKSKIKRIQNVLRWIPIIWNDRDWDYYHIYEILKQKLKHVEQHTVKNGNFVDSDKDIQNLRTAIDMIDKVQNEYYLEKYLSSPDWEKEDIGKAVKDHDKARRELFRFLSNNIERWWD